MRITRSKGLHRCIIKYLPGETELSTTDRLDKINIFLSVLENRLKLLEVNKYHNVLKELKERKRELEGGEKKNNYVHKKRN